MNDKGAEPSGSEEAKVTGQVAYPEGEVPELLPDQASSEHGRFTGSLVVDSNGDAAYSIPIEIPPGRAGIQPSLALSYSSGRGLGHVGVGWSLAGLDAIVRCPRNVAKDGRAEPVRYDSTDRFCFGGQRLVETAATSSHGGREFRTERDENLKFVAFDNGVAASSSAWNVVRWELWLPSGRLRHYGSSPQSRVDDGLQHTGRWLLEKEEDRFGNSFFVTYDRPTHPSDNRVQGEDLEVIPQAIDYTYNDGSGGGEGLGPANRIYFAYDVEETPRFGFRSGVGFAISRRLSSISTYHATTLVRRYKISYRPSQLTGRSLVDSVRSCDRNDVCLPPLSMDYSTGKADFLPGVDVGTALDFDTGLPSGNDDRRALALHDVTGDGRAELVISRETGSHVAVFVSSYDADDATFPAPALANALIPHDGAPPLFKFADLTADGKSDLVFRNRDLQDWMLFRSASTLTQGALVNGAGILGLADLDGNGDTDIFRSRTNGVPPDYAIMDGSAAPANLITLGYSAPRDESKVLSKHRFVDIDGDGAVEVLQLLDDGGNGPEFPTQLLDFSDPNAPSITVLPVSYDFMWSQTNCNPCNDYSWIRLFADVNGDGLDDVIRQFLFLGPDHVNGTSDDVVLESHVLASAGRGFVPTGWMREFPAPNLHNVHVTDVNQDGRDDFVLIDGVGAYAQIYVSQGLDGTASLLTSSTLPTLSPGDEVAWGDVDGNGTDDALIYRRSGGKTSAMLYLAEAPKADLLTGVQEATVEIWDVEYETLNHPEVYERTSGCTTQGPALCLEGSRAWVVAATERYTGPHTPARRRTWHYEDLVFDRQGLGRIGFRAIEIQDDQARTTVRTEYDLETYDPFFHRYPFAGLVTKAARTTHNRPIQGAAGGVDVWENIHETDYAYVAQGSSYRALPAVVTNAVDGYQWANRFAHGDPLSTTTRVYSDYDDFGYPGTVDITSPDGERTTITRTYDHSSSTWLLGRVDAISTESQMPDGQTALRRRALVWNPQTGNLSSMTNRLEAQGPGADELTTHFGYDAYGNLNQLIDLDASGNGRTTSFAFDGPERTFMTSVTNTLGHETNYLFHSHHGGIRRVVDPNGLRHLVGYDLLGRAVESVDEAGRQTTYEYAAPSAPARQSFRMIERAEGAPPTETGFDVLGRTVYRAYPGFDGGLLKELLTYDELGRIEARSRPVPMQSIDYAWDTWVHDEMGRLRVFQRADGATWTYEYGPGEGFLEGGTEGGFSRSVRNPRGYRRKEILDGRRRVVAVIDELGERTTYGYGPFGLPSFIVDALGHRFDMEFDAYGYKTSQTDPDIGSVAMEYNAFGELERTVDSMFDVTFDYDGLGRPISRVSTSGDSTTWVYDSTPNGVGRLAEETSFDGHVTRYFYDGAGRVSRSQHVVDSTSYDFQFGYDQFGRLGRLEYPTAVDGSSFSVEYDYANGYVSAVREESTEFVLWRRLQNLPSGALGAERYGNGVETTYERGYNGRLRAKSVTNAGGALLGSKNYYYDQNDNLIGRVDGMQQMTELFSYDEIDRLTGARFEVGAAPVSPPEPIDPTGFEGTNYVEPVWAPLDAVIPSSGSETPAENENVDILIDRETPMPIALAASLASVGASPATPATGMGVQASYVPHLGITYDAIGNILYRSDVGDYAYDDLRPDGVPRAHAVSGTSPTQSGHPVGRTFVYDAAGNVKTDGIRTFRYNSEHKVRDVRMEDGVIVRYEYDARTRRVIERAPNETIVTVGPLFTHRAIQPPTDASILTAEVGVTEWSVAVEGRVVARVHQIESALDVTSDLMSLIEAEEVESFDLSEAHGRRYVTYLHHDVVGSTDLVTKADGFILDQRSYDAFGQLRSVDWSAGSVPPSTSSRHVGFTGHRDDRHVGLVDMIGRMYDPSIGRFTTPDPFVQSPRKSQSLNRFAYVFNNPLKYVDPSGFQAESDGDKVEFTEKEGSEIVVGSPSEATPRRPIVPSDAPSNADGAKPDLEAPIDSDFEKWDVFVSYQFGKPAPLSRLPVPNRPDTRNLVAFGPSSTSIPVGHLADGEDVKTGIYVVDELMKRVLGREAVLKELMGGKKVRHDGVLATAEVDSVWLLGLKTRSVTRPRGMGSAASQVGAPIKEVSDEYGVGISKEPGVTALHGEKVTSGIRNRVATVDAITGHVIARSVLFVVKVRYGPFIEKRVGIQLTPRDPIPLSTHRIVE